MTRDQKHIKDLEAQYRADQDTIKALQKKCDKWESLSYSMQDKVKELEGKYEALSDLYKGNEKALKNMHGFYKERGIMIQKLQVQVASLQKQLRDFEADEGAQDD